MVEKGSVTFSSLLIINKHFWLAAYVVKTVPVSSLIIVEREQYLKYYS